jgi:hypothetical protein
VFAAIAADRLRAIGAIIDKDIPMKARHTVVLAAMFVASLAFAQAGKPYQSTFQDYRPYADGAPGDWRSINQSVTTAQAAGAHDHGTGKDASGGHDHGSTQGGAGGAPAHDHGAGHMHKGMDHGAMQRMHKGMDHEAMKKMHEQHMQHMQAGGKGGHEGHAAPEKKQ